MGLVDEANVAAAAVRYARAAREQARRDRATVLQAMSPLIAEAPIGLFQRNVPNTSRGVCTEHGQRDPRLAPGSNS